MKDIAMHYFKQNSIIWPQKKKNENIDWSSVQITKPLTSNISIIYVHKIFFFFPATLTSNFINLILVASYSKNIGLIDVSSSELNQILAIIYNKVYKAEWNPKSRGMVDGMSYTLKTRAIKNISRFSTNNIWLFQCYLTKKLFH